MLVGKKDASDTARQDRTKSIIIWSKNNPNGTINNSVHTCQDYVLEWPSDETIQELIQNQLPQKWKKTVLCNGQKYKLDFSPP